MRLIYDFIMVGELFVLLMVTDVICTPKLNIKKTVSISKKNNFIRYDAENI